LRATLQTAAEGGLAIALPAIADLKPGSGYRVVSHAPEALLLLQEVLPPGYLAGDLSTLGVAEVFGQILAGIRSGQLLVQRGEIRRAVIFRDGQLTFATSNAPRERLGHRLVQRGLVTQAQLETALTEVKPGVRLGQALTRQKALSHSALYSAMAELVKSIVLGLFELPDGHFLFLEERVVAEDSVKLSERTRDLLLQGVKRNEELVRLRQKYPPAFRVAAGSTAPEKGLEGLLAQVGAGVELGTLSAGFDGTDWELLTAVERLLKSGSLQVAPSEDEAPPASSVPVSAPAKPAAAKKDAAEAAPAKKAGSVPPSAPKKGAASGKPVPAKKAAAKVLVPAAEPPQAPVNPNALDLYSALIKSIAGALRDAGLEIDTLRSFFSDPLPGMESAFVGVELTDEGTLDVERVFTNLRSDDPAISRALAFEALDAFVSYALFSAKNVLAPEEARRLAAEFKHMQEGVEG
jgi:hypothetical protein